MWDRGLWALGHWSDRRYARNLAALGMVLVAWGIVALFVPRPFAPLIPFGFGSALVVASIVLYRLSPPEDEDDG